MQREEVGIACDMVWGHWCAAVMGGWRNLLQSAAGALIWQDSAAVITYGPWGIQPWPLRSCSTLLYVISGKVLYFLEILT